MIDQGAADSQRVSREEAVQLATEALVARGDQARPHGLERGMMVLDYDTEFDRVRPPLVYGAALTGSWIVYCDRRDGFRGLRSSYIVVVDQRTGAVRYIGPANDEG